LREKLWPTETFVEFDDGLNTAVQKVRQVIGDEARNPRFVETVPRRGYRFIAPVQIDGEPQVAAVVMDTQPASAPAPAPSVPQRHIRWIWICVASALAGLALGLLVARPTVSPPPLTLKLTITPPPRSSFVPDFAGVAPSRPMAAP
jgi:hypothetical protein